MWDLKLRLVNMLGLITLVVVAALLIDYFRLLRRPTRLGVTVALCGLVVGGALTLTAVLPDNEILGPVVFRGDGGEKLVALTFDDGPYPPYTGEVLDLLAEFRVPATFFVVGENADRHPELLKRMAREGHQVGSHTYHHVDLLKLNARELAAEMDQTSWAIQSITGHAPTAMRPPHGFRDPAILAAMKERNLKVVEWSVMSRDWTNPGVETIVERTLSKVKNGSIILLHDGDGLEAKASRAQSVAAARIIIERLQEEGYRFVTVDELQRQKTEGAWQ